MFMLGSIIAESYKQNKKDFSLSFLFFVVNRYDIMCILIAGSYKKCFFPFFPLFNRNDIIWKMALYLNLLLFIILMMMNWHSMMDRLNLHLTHNIYNYKLKL